VVTVGRNAWRVPCVGTGWYVILDVKWKHEMRGLSDLKEHQTLAAVVTAIAIAGAAKLSYEWYQELVFYRNHGWNFTVDHEVSFFLYRRKKYRKQTSNQLRVLFEYPFLILAMFVIVFVFGNQLAIINKV
jgi:hypothetical protein